jgi:hypothetical protein
VQDYLYLITPNMYPLNKKYRDFEAPFYGLNDKVPICLTIVLGLQHALTMIGSVVSPPLAIAGGAFNLNSAQTQYLVSAAFITTGISTAVQVTRIHLMQSPWSRRLLIFSPSRSAIWTRTCPVDATGARLPYPEA